MKLRALLAWMCLLLVASAAWAEPAADDLLRKELIQLRVGERTTLSFKGLVRFSIANTAVLLVRHIEGDAVTVEAIAAGETWIEIVHDQRALTALRVVVSAGTASPAAGPSPSPSAAPSSSAGAAGSPSPSPAVVATPSPSPGGAGSPSPSPAVVGKPSPSPSPAASGANQRALMRDDNPFRIGLELDYGVDTQTFPTLVTFIDASGRAAVATVNTRVKRQFEELPVTLDWSASRQDRLSAVFPFITTTQVTSSPLQSEHASASGLGDIALTYEHTFNRRPVGGWETGAQVSMSFPTGRSVYDITNPTELPLGVGHFQTGAGFVVRRVTDPLALYGTLGVNYTIPRGFNGTTVAPGVGWNASTGISWAMSDQWALSEQLTYARRPNIFLATPTQTITQNVDQAYITQSVTFSDRRGAFLLRLLFTAGLNDASTDFIGGVSAQWRH